MEYISVKEAAKNWGVSERTARNYCATGRVEGAFLTGKTWNIPVEAIKPLKENVVEESDNNLLNVLRREKDSNMSVFH